MVTLKNMTTVTIILLVIVKVVENAVSMEITMPPNEVKVVTVPVNGSIKINASGESSGMAYILCQAHTQTGKVTLSLQPLIQYSTAVTGQDVGVISTQGDRSDFTWYLFSNSTKDIRVLIHATYYTYSDPLVGGCNLEFNLENDPNVVLHVQSTKTRVQFQWSNTRDSQSCEDTTVQSYLKYDTYVKYLQADDFSEDSYFDVLSQMLTADRITEYGTWLHEISNTDAGKSFLDVSSYRQRGVVYGIVVTMNNPRTGIHTGAAYVPVVSYGCDIEDVASCKQRDIAGSVLGTLGGLVGLFLSFFGHRFFKTENFLFGFLIFSLIFYQLLGLETHMSYVGTLMVAAVFGLIGGALLLGMWWYLGIPVLNVLFIGLMTGYIVSSCLFYTPLGNLSYFSTPFNYGATFACGVLVIPVILLLFTRFLSIFSCAVVGSFGVVLMLDMYFQSGLHVIILNSVRHGTDTNYVKVLVTGPYTNHEIALTVVWLWLLAVGLSFQIIRERKKAPFPPCPRQQHERAKDLRNLLRTNHSTPDREPLLRGDNYRNYGSQRRPQTHDEETEDQDEVHRPRMV